MSLRKAQNIFMPKNINSFTIINITLEGIEKIITTKQCEQSREHLQVEWFYFSLNENEQ